MGVIDWRMIEREGVTYLVQLFPDGDTDPNTDGDWATPDQVAAWLRGEWRYVTAVVSTAPDRFASLGALVWGDLPHASGPCGWGYLEDEVLSDLIDDLEGN